MKTKPYLEFNGVALSVQEAVYAASVMVKKHNINTTPNTAMLNHKSYTSYRLCLGMMFEDKIQVDVEDGNYFGTFGMKLIKNNKLPPKIGYLLDDGVILAVIRFSI